jgi:hypothetical protein
MISLKTGAPFHKVWHVLRDVIFNRQAPIGDDNYLLLAARVRHQDSSQPRMTCSLPK